MTSTNPNPIQNGQLHKAQRKMLDMLIFVETVCQKHGLEYWLEGGSLLGAIRHQGFIPWDDDLDISMPRASFEAFLKIAPTELPAHLFLQTHKTDVGYFNLSVQLKIRDRNSRYIEKCERGDEPYQQGIFIDIFAYDQKPASALRRALYRWMSKKLLRLLFHKYSPMHLYTGHYPKVYNRLACMMPKAWLEKGLERIIYQANKEDSPFLGYGYDCTNMTYFPKEVFYPLKRAVFEGHEFYIPNQAERILTRQFGDYSVLPPEHARIMKHCQELYPEY